MNNSRLITVPLSSVESLISKVEILPLKDVINTNDGRQFKLTNPLAVVTASQKEGVDMLVDYDHDSLNENIGHLRSTAAGWIKRLSITENAIVGEVHWTSKARAQIQNGEFRYLSPTLITHEDGTIIRIKNVALTNEPALPLEAKLSQQSNPEATKSIDKDKTQIISELKEHYQELGISGEEVEAALSNVSQLAQHDVDEARGKYFLPKAIESELLLVRQTVGAEKFKSVIHKLSQNGFGFAHLNQRQTDRLSIHTLRTSDQRTQDELEACEATGISKEEFLKAKDKKK